MNASNQLVLLLEHEHNTPCVQARYIPGTFIDALSARQENAICGLSTRLSTTNN